MRLPGAGTRWSVWLRGLEEAVHHQDVGEPLLCVPERFGNSTNDDESMFLPQVDRGHVGCDDGVELHRQEARIARRGERVLAQRAANALSPRRRRDHISAVGDM